MAVIVKIKRFSDDCAEEVLGRSLTKQLVSEVLDNVEKMCKKIVNDELSDFKNQDNVRMKLVKAYSKILQHTKKEATFIIRPTNQQAAADTKKEIENKIDVVKVEVSVLKIREVFNRTVIIECEDDASIKKNKS